MVTKMTALLLGVVLVTSACDARATSESATDLRKPLRVAMRAGDTLDVLQGLRQFSIQLLPIGDSQKRLEALEDGTVDVTNAVADATFAAFYRGAPGRTPLKNIRGIALMNRAVVHLLVGPHVEPTKSLRGMRIVLGDPAGASRSIGERLINAMGVPLSQISGEFVPYEDGVDKLLRGETDAVIASVLPPQEVVIRALRGGARLRELSGAEVDRLREHYPLLRRTVLPAGTYPGQNAPLHTVGVDLLLVCRADLDSDIVYSLTRAMFETMRGPMRRELDPYRAPATVIPLHQGAARYYREREMQR